MSIHWSIIAFRILITPGYLPYFTIRNNVFNFLSLKIKSYCICIPKVEWWQGMTLWAGHSSRLICCLMIPLTSGKFHFPRVIIHNHFLLNWLTTNSRTILAGAKWSLSPLTIHVKVNFYHWKLIYAGPFPKTTNVKGHSISYWAKM